MDIENVAIFIPIVAIVFSLSIPIIAIITEAAKHRKIYEMYNKERLAAIEKGIELPPLPLELFDKESSRTGKRPRYLLNGLIWLLVGLGLLAALYFDLDRREWALYALIPAGIGLAYLLYYAIEGRKEEEQVKGSQSHGALHETFKP
jgi:hypothetical protein